MKIKPGQLIEEFKAKDGKKIIFRTPKNSDLFQLLNFINALVKEDTFILIAKRKTIKEEKEYLKNVLSLMKKGKGIWLVGLYKNKIVAHGSVEVGNGERSPHVGEIRLAVLKTYRNLGIGKRLLSLLINFGKRLGVQIPFTWGYG
ncbi:MAG: GNAT family N-acetyltransferase [Candidatus Aenigmatarchaeota archaeon]